MAADELVDRILVAGLAPALGQSVFMLRLEQRDLPYLLEIAGEAGVEPCGRRGGSARCHAGLL
jgi:hypothetical protein